MQINKILRITDILKTLRPAFLLLTPCCLSLAVAFAINDGIKINPLKLLLIFVGALAAHASVNMLNEYADFKSGLDFHTHRTPFSGGSGTLPALPELAETVRIGGLICLLITLMIGFYFLQDYGWPLLLVGILGIVLVYFYTNWITRWPYVCLVSPGLGFGPLMISGAYYVLAGHYSTAVFMTSLIVFFLVNNLLLLNQFPDLEADRSIGRCHLPVLIGRKKSVWVYICFLFAAYTLLLLCVYLSLLPVYSLLGLLTLLLALPAARISLRYADDMEKLKPALALNVLLILTTPLLVSSGLIWQSLL